MLSFEQGERLSSPSGATLMVRYREARARPRASMVVLHGLAEHSLRYERLANELGDSGLNVIAHDHRGHGHTRAPDAPPRRFAARDGDLAVLTDCRAVLDFARLRAPDLPLIVLGHSLGGIIALNVARRWGSDLAGVLVWNASSDAGPALKVANVALAVEKALKGSDVASAIMARATFDSWGRSIANRRSEADWLSHDVEAVQRYRNDPLCGWRPTVSMWEDILRLVRTGASDKALASLPPALPLHLLGGTQDPATGHGRAVERLARRARTVGLRNVTSSLVQGARHETLNETLVYRAVAMEALARWIDTVLLPFQPAS